MTPVRDSLYGKERKHHSFQGPWDNLDEVEVRKSLVSIGNGILAVKHAVIKL
jgi:hypothetical protein